MFKCLVLLSLGVSIFFLQLLIVAIGFDHHNGWRLLYLEWLLIIFLDSKFAISSNTFSLLDMWWKCFFLWFIELNSVPEKLSIGGFCCMRDKSCLSKFSIFGSTLVKIGCWFTILKRWWIRLINRSARNWKDWQPTLCIAFHYNFLIKRKYKAYVDENSQTPILFR